MNILTGRRLSSICELELEKALRDVVEEVTGTPGKQKDSKLPDWINDNLKSLVYELGLENKVKKIEKKIAKEDLLEVLQYTLLKRNSLLQEANLKGSANACLAKQT
ncbi:hypothetical protein GLOIN_2v1790954 [Rhizophagus clarus]|uniref:Uncharacterized protein n=1 Tax=Rhizophagus clarus TaxID=94130 RepID=A0A8H3LNV0_9GLOM|nr:hypothetical protein GLOIN_2v1790954 [Rhizophagus clarus]